MKTKLTFAVVFFFTISRVCADTTDAYRLICEKDSQIVVTGYDQDSIVITNNSGLNVVFQEHKVIEFKCPYTNVNAIAEFPNDYTVKCDSCDVDSLKTDLEEDTTLVWDVEYIWSVTPLGSCTQHVPNDLTGSNETLMNLIKGQCAWNITKGSLSTGIAIIDNVGGLDTTGHEDLKGGKIILYKGIKDNKFRLHGTWVAGCAAANTDNGVGISSIGYDCGLMLYNIASSFTTPEPKPAGVQAIFDAADDGAKVINLSWRPTTSAVPDLLTAIDYAVSKGVVVVIAAGLVGTANPLNKAPNTITVSMTSMVDVAHNIHTYNVDVDICAPGDNYLSTRWKWWDGPYETMNSATSFSAGLLSGVIGLMYTVDPSLTIAEVTDILESTAVNIYNIRANRPYFGKMGAGRVDAYGAVCQTYNNLTYGVGGYTFNSGDDITWNTTNTINGTVLIKDGAKLTIDGTTISFGVKGNIFVEAGGRLIINNATLTGTCEKMWKGIEVRGISNQAQGDPYDPNNPQGFIHVKNGSVIEHANTAVKLTGYLESPGVWKGSGGIIIADNSSFINNRISVELGHYRKFSKSTFDDCTFLCNAPLFGRSPYGKESIDVFVSVNDMNLVWFRGNSFKNVIPNQFHERKRGTAIKSYYSIIIVGTGNVGDGNTFDGLTKGIDAYSIGGIDDALVVRDNIFNNVILGIVIGGAAFGTIRDNYFDIPGKCQTGSCTTPIGSLLWTTTGFLTHDNQFLSTSEEDNYGTVIRSSFDFGGLVYKNSFSGINWVATQMEYDNDFLQIKCNTYNNNDRDWVNAVGSLADQGRCVTGDKTTAAGNQFHPSCIGKSHINVGPNVDPFVYNSHTDLLPICTTTVKLTVVDCVITSDGTSCPATPGIGGGSSALKASIDEEEDPIEKKQQIAELMRYYLEENDSLDEAILYLETLSSTEARKLLVPTYLQKEDYTNAQIALDSIPKSSFEDKQFHKLFDMLTGYLAAGNLLQELTFPEKQSVIDVADSGSLVSVAAQSILADIDDSLYFRIPEPFDDSASSKAPNEIKSEDIKKINHIKIYPNPASNSIIVESLIFDEKQKVVFTVYDLIGRKRIEYVLDKPLIEISTNNLSNGINTYKLSVNDVIEQQGKISILK